MERGVKWPSLRFLFQKLKKSEPELGFRKRFFKMIFIISRESKFRMVKFNNFILIIE